MILTDEMIFLCDEDHAGLNSDLPRLKVIDDVLLRNDAGSTFIALTRVLLLALALTRTFAP